MQYLQEARIRKAMTLLLNTGKSVEEIAAETGFSSGNILEKYSVTIWESRRRHTGKNGRTVLSEVLVLYEDVLAEKFREYGRKKGGTKRNGTRNIPIALAFFCFRQDVPSASEMYGNFRIW